MGNICEKWGTPCAPGSLGLLLAQKQVWMCCSGPLWGSSQVFLAPAPVGWSGALSSFTALPKLSPGWREEFWEKGRDLGPYFSSSPPLDRIKACGEKVRDRPVVLNLWWMIIQPIPLLKNTSIDPKHFFKR